MPTAKLKIVIVSSGTPLLRYESYGDKSALFCTSNPTVTGQARESVPVSIIQCSSPVTRLQRKQKLQQLNTVKTIA